MPCGDIQKTRIFFLIAAPRRIINSMTNRSIFVFTNDHPRGPAVNYSATDKLFEIGTKFRVDHVQLSHEYDGSKGPLYIVVNYETDAPIVYAGGSSIKNCIAIVYRGRNETIVDADVRHICGYAEDRNETLMMEFLSNAVPVRIPMGGIYVTLTVETLGAIASSSDDDTSDASSSDGW